MGDLVPEQPSARFVEIYRRMRRARPAQGELAPPHAYDVSLFTRTPVTERIEWPADLPTPPIGLDPAICAEVYGETPCQYRVDHDDAAAVEALRERPRRTPRGIRGLVFRGEPWIFVTYPRYRGEAIIRNVRACAASRLDGPGVAGDLWN
jgi:hypothetical protein